MVDYNPFAPDVQHNPYPVWKQLRDEAPVYHNPDFGFYALSRYDDVLAAFLDPTTFISGKGVTIGGPEKSDGRLIGSDAPEHTRVRKVLSRVFTPKRVADLEPFIRGVAARYLDGARDRDRFDLVQEFSLRMPLEVIGELLGIPAEFRDTIHDLANTAVTRDPDPTISLEKARAAMVEVRAIYTELVVERRKHPGDDPISMLIEAEVTDDDGSTHRLSDEQITANFVLLGAAGHETVMKLIGNGAVALAWYPDQRAELVRDPGLIPNAVEEMLRWDNPAPLEGRWCTRDFALHGVTIPADTRVMLLMGAANHDDRVYDNPELFNIHRKIERPLVFGFGVHLCIGAALARLETRIAFEELLSRFPEYELIEDGISRGPATFFRGLTHLPIVPRPSREAH
jgi:cytochrome P450